MSTSYRFAAAELWPERRQLLVAGQDSRIGARAFDVLLTLIERRERIVGKNELLERVWPGVVVEENNLQVQISTLRRLVGPQAIATIPGRGYRFVATLDGEPEAGAPVAVADATPAAAAEAGIRRPPAPPPLYGRSEELSALGALLASHRLVTVVGAGGIGKSRLAQAAAHALAGRWSDGACMIELAGLSEPSLSTHAVAQALGIHVPGDEVAALAALLAALGQRRLLLVLDNCEHLLEACTALVQAVLQGTHGVSVLATSQEPLRLADEQQYRLVPLAVPAATDVRGARAYGALALFEARVHAADPRFALSDENLPLVIDICRELDGLPLAIELAAARVATLGLRPVRDKLHARFKLLTGGSRSTLRRHQTLRAALEWSHNLLDDDERAVFRRLGVFAGGCTMQTAQAVAADGALDEWAVLDHLSALIEKSLVVADAGATPRYRLLESARAFALEQLAAANETPATLKRHAQAMAQWLQSVDDRNMDGELRTDQYAALVPPELDNLRAAYAWATGEAADTALAIRLAAHAGSLIDYAGECAGWLLPWQRRVEDGAVDVAVEARYWRALAAGNMSARLSPAMQGQAARRASDLYRGLDQPRRVFSSLTLLSRYLATAQQDHAAAQAALDEARALLRPDWPPEFHIVLLRRSAALARDMGRTVQALALYRDSARASAASGDWRLEVMARTAVVDLSWETGPRDAAAREAIELVQALRERPAADSDAEVALANAIGVLSELGRIEEASALARESLSVMRRTQSYIVDTWVHLFWRRGQLDPAALLLGALDARRARDVAPAQPNEARLVAEARAAIEKSFAPAVLQSRLVAGAALAAKDLDALIGAALESPPRGDEAA